ncbi:hypothetical protein DRW48_02960 [Paracoccus suum]|uniref:Uncharacterized protein n=1 Tax=Paracoccus suum TaxID=2259340 RepID=A0A344PHD4_9RHOB|nr:hypothetical protein [Paracoccus suum]AXC48789.1 hypothetical protein DRW48_02960 [Paracoccus suum]
MIARIETGPGLPRDELDRLIAQYGPARIAGMLLVALVYRRRFRVRVVGPTDLSPYLQRDIGLPPSPARGRNDHLRFL